MKTKAILVICICTFFSLTAHAQYWSVWHKTGNNALGLSSDEKWAFFIQKNDAGIDNIYKVELKTNTVSPVTNFMERPVLSGIVLFGKPAVVYARASTAKGDDIHLYRINVTTTDPPVDFTPKEGPSTRKILGMAANGSYVYYLADRGPGSKTDTYRYDAAQYITELAFANDKDFETLCWSKDQTHLLLRDPKLGVVYNYSIETTDKQKLDLPFAGDELKTAFYDPPNTSIYLINKGNQLTKSKITSAGTSDVETGPNWAGVMNANLSLNAKYFHLVMDKSEKVLDNSSRAFVEIPAGAYDEVVGPKELSVLYVMNDGVAKKLYLYDIAKKAAKELAVIK
ncbi:MAG: hypothetical protein Q8919_14610 [Bacteroidota bacterium]|nr:hypothetical protein [Bacteroidota bacterium]